MAKASGLMRGVESPSANCRDQPRERPRQRAKRTSTRGTAASANGQTPADSGPPSPQSEQRGFARPTHPWPANQRFQNDVQSGLDAQERLSLCVRQAELIHKVVVLHKAEAEL